LLLPLDLPEDVLALVHFNFFVALRIADIFLLEKLEQFE
jgi:hypothetical protein